MTNLDTKSVTLPTIFESRVILKPISASAIDHPKHEFYAHIIMPTLRFFFQEASSDRSDSRIIGEVSSIVAEKINQPSGEKSFLKHQKRSNEGLQLGNILVVLRFPTLSKKLDVIKEPDVSISHVVLLLIKDFKTSEAAAGKVIGSDIRRVLGAEVVFVGD